MARRVVARGSNAIVLAVALFVGAYVINGWFASRGWHTPIHKGPSGDWKPWLGQCSALGVKLWVPCWVTVAAPVILVAAALGLFRKVD